MARHALTRHGVRFGLRPLEATDGAFVVGIRTDAELGRYLNPTSNSLDDQLAWYAGYLERPDDFSFVVEDLGSGHPEGAVSLYNVDRAAGDAELGRFILRRGSLAATEAVWLVYQLAFESLELDRVYCRTIRANRQVVSFHRSCGLTETAELEVQLRGQQEAVVEQSLTSDDWPRVAARLDRLARAAAHFAGGDAGGR